MAVPLLQSEQLMSLGVRHGFTTRAGGVSEEPFDTLNLNRAGEDNRSHVDTNYARVAEALAFSPGALFEATQVHGHRV
ncbi:MAG: laccase domain-containing protein, partial [Myxococcales bacterium]|nr:laccase domain-containing protein [Myxococcales bacterium]